MFTWRYLGRLEEADDVAVRVFYGRDQLAPPTSLTP
jgi:hypothetical protein